MRRTVYTEDHESFRALAREFVERELAPKFQEYEDAGRIDKAVFAKMGELGLIGLQIPEEFGGGGQTDTFKYNAILTEETARACTSLGSLRVHQDVVTPYILEYATHEQKGRWLPGMANGTLMAAIAMTERARARTSPASARARSSARTAPGCSTGRRRSSPAVRMRTSCSSSRAPARTTRTTAAEASRSSSSRPTPPASRWAGACRRSASRARTRWSCTSPTSSWPTPTSLGEPGRAFEYMSHNLAQERLTIAVNAVSTAQAAIRLASEYAQERKSFGQPLSSFQNTKFVLAECSTETTAAQAMLDQALEAHDAGELSPADAARVKLFTTEVQGRVIDNCLQVHGGYGYILEYPIARLYTDARVTRIYGGTSEVMKTIIAKDMGLSARRS